MSLRPTVSSFLVLSSEFNSYKPIDTKLLSLRMSKFVFSSLYEPYTPMISLSYILSFGIGVPGTFIFCGVASGFWTMILPFSSLSIGLKQRNLQQRDSSTDIMAAPLSNSPQ